jgi:DNA-binding NarL/FixJ family response regulator
VTALPNVAPTAVLADDHAAMRESVAEVLTRAGYEVVGQAPDARTAIMLVRRYRPTVCLLDINMPGDGIAAARTICDKWPATAVVMMSVLRDDQHLFEALRAGARGYLVKGTAPAVLIKRLQALLEGEPALSPGMAMRLVEQFGRGRTRRVFVPNRGPVDLSPKEAQVLDHLREGLRTDQIARRMFVAPVTVRSHVASLMKKLEVNDREELARCFDVDDDTDVH